jgi:hypothetical protein
MGFPIQTSIRNHRQIAHRVRFVGLGLAVLLTLPAQAQDTALAVDTAVGEQFRNSSLSDYSLPGREATSYDPYDTRSMEPALEMGLSQQELGDHRAAVSAFEQALQIARVNYGLFHESQIPLVESIIYSLMEIQDWESVDRQFDYMAHLYRRLYDIDDPRLESGLQKISSYHVNAFNINLEGRGEYHLRKAANLFKLRLEVAEQTLTEDHPKLDYLNESLALSREHLYLMSNRHKQRMKKIAQSSRDNLLADLQ